MSSKRHLRRRSCANKQRFADQDAAKKANRRGCWPYRCTFCGGWHYGRANRRQRQGERARKAVIDREGKE